ncbi:hypothetical protein EV667_2193 [Ancylobacter aquaticus]|uniref:Uncharacterized protein n=1 Tax=Ancylobacter aquaticus TaxID=100 RepID=A0A4R1I2N6_ANCAQ|nr:hypothetical protein [Ancylobacter aquaticus]TCK28193.1 hypothetical protein EV667_2193 [Ancylobacter aquaticus]
MSHTLPASAVPLSKPALTRLETKAEAISRAAMETIHQEVARREAKTAQLRAARLAKEASERAAAAAKPAPAAKRKVASAR